MKRKSLIGLIALILLATHLVAGWKIERNEYGTYDMIMFTDGGSIALSFVNNTGERKLLILDKAFRVIHETDEYGFPTEESIGPLKQKEDGLLYWGEEDFEAKKPIRSSNSLLTEIETELKEWIGDEDEATGDQNAIEPGYLSEFLVAIGRNRSNK